MISLPYIQNSSEPSRQCCVFPHYGQVLASLLLGAILSGFIAMLAASHSGRSIYWDNPYRSSQEVRRAALHSEEKRVSEIRTRFDQGVAMLQVGQFNHAITAFHRVLTLDPKLPEAHVNMGYAFFELGDYVGAKRFFDGALSLSPSLANAHYGRAITLFKLGDRADAAQSMRRYLDLASPDDPFRGKALTMLREADSLLNSNSGPKRSPRVQTLPDKQKAGS